ncbi:ParB/RepB/Spo0J family partition protein [Pseudaestuariivita atlantica]|uniref:Plasmid partitioning protein ParB n=1 Tax=Pseudaestuariivita atlantica TaxID=1317121 RepID=A0A0L1JK92_9RHOB|nr:ParB N-terminal domain-containing protein [Pseudaestuariivita atlantica]KNG92170.1 plasmid partitioning protein ParB [Pseudaestuariivita atlantica]
MSKKNKFGFGPLDPPAPVKRDRSVGPMGAAVREVAESLTQSTEAKVEQRKQNAEDAKSWRAAQEDGRVLERVPLDDVDASDLPRDRLELEAVAASDEMEELKASIRERGQKEPVELYVDRFGGLQLKKGWRRLTALRQLFAETRDDAYATILARIDRGSADRINHYVDMVEENVVREDLTFAEMAQVCIAAAQDDFVDGYNAEDMVLRLYGALHKMKRSYIRSFVFLLENLGDDLKWPKSVARNLGVDVARRLRDGGDIEGLREALRAASDIPAQIRALEAVLKPDRPAPKDGDKAREKFEFHVGEMKVTARQGECRIVARADFASLPRDQLERAIKAFQDVLDERSGPHVTNL